MKHLWTEKKKRKEKHVLLHHNQKNVFSKQSKKKNCLASLSQRIIIKHAGAQCKTTSTLWFYCHLVDLGHNHIWDSACRHLLMTLCTVAAVASHCHNFKWWQSSKMNCLISNLLEISCKWARRGCIRCQYYCFSIIAFITLPSAAPSLCILTAELLSHVRHPAVSLIHSGASTAWNSSLISGPVMPSTCTQCGGMQKSPWCICNLPPILCQKQIN